MSDATFTRGVLHWNDGRFFEAHEAWEELWADEVDPTKRWLQGLIQLAAAFVHFERGFHATGFVKLVRSAREKMAAYAGPTFGLDAGRLLADLEPWSRHAEAVARGAPLGAGAPPLPVLVIGKEPPG